jgi:hypothetical protein
MAYMNQEKKAKIFAEMKKLLDKSLGWKFTMAVRNHSTLVLNIARGPADFLGGYTGGSNPDKSHVEATRARGYLDVNPYWIEQNYTPDVAELLLAIKDIMNDGNWDKSDIQTDYFNVGWYIDINIGQYSKPYELVFEQQAAA